MLYLRNNKQFLNADKLHLNYKSSKQAFNKLGMDMNDLTKSFAENPNIADIDQIMVTLAVPAEAIEPLEIRYLYGFFEVMFTNSTPGVKNATVIQDKLSKMVLTSESITKTRNTYLNGPNPAYASGKENTTRTVQVWNTYKEMFYPQEEAVTYHWYRKQISATTYDEIRILNLGMAYHMAEGFVSTTYQSVNATGKTAVLLVPLDSSITKFYKLKEREKLYALALRYVINTRTQTTLDWYQSPSFGFLMMVVAIIIMVYTFDPEWVTMVGEAWAGVPGACQN
jgi:hypothetical protein